MSNVNKYIPQSIAADAHAGYGGREFVERPSLSQRTQTMPAAWQTRGVASSATLYENGQNVRSFIDQAKDPIRWCMSSKAHMAGTAVAAAVLLTLLT